MLIAFGVTNGRHIKYSLLVMSSHCERLSDYIFLHFCQKKILSRNCHVRFIVFNILVCNETVELEQCPVLHPSGSVSYNIKGCVASIALVSCPCWWSYSGTCRYYSFLQYHHKQLAIYPGGHMHPPRPPLCRCWINSLIKPGWYVYDFSYINNLHKIYTSNLVSHLQGPIIHASTILFLTYLTSHRREKYIWGGPPIMQYFMLYNFVHIHVENFACCETFCINFHLNFWSYCPPFNCSF